MIELSEHNQRKLIHLQCRDETIYNNGDHTETRRMIRGSSDTDCSKSDLQKHTQRNIYIGR